MHVQVYEQPENIRSLPLGEALEKYSSNEGKNADYVNSDDDYIIMSYL